MILPLNKTPIVYTPIHANFLSVALSCSKGYEWFFEHYINIYLRIKQVESPDDYFDTQASYVDLSLLDRNYSPLLEVYSYPKELLDVPFHSFVVELLNNGYYVFSRLDHFYLHCSWRYNTKHILHTTLISGYENEDFILTDYFDIHYSTKKASFADVNLAYRSISRLDMGKPHFHYQKDEIVFFKPAKESDISYSFSLVNTVRYLFDYFLGNDSTARLRNELAWFESFGAYEYHYGVNCIKLIAELYAERRLTQREFHLLYEHKKNMALRLTYFLEHGYLDSDYFHVKYSEMATTALSIRDYVAKCEMLGKKSVNYAKIIAKCEKLQKTESEVLAALIERLISHNRLTCPM